MWRAVRVHTRDGVAWGPGCQGRGSCFSWFHLKASVWIPGLSCVRWAGRWPCRPAPPRGQRHGSRGVYAGCELGPSTTAVRAQEAAHKSRSAVYCSVGGLLFLTLVSCAWASELGDTALHSWAQAGSVDGRAEGCHLQALSSAGRSRWASPASRLSPKVSLLCQG